MASTRIRVRTDGSTYTQVRYRINRELTSTAFDDHGDALLFKKRVEALGPMEARRLLGIEHATRHEITLADWCTLHCDQLTGIEPETIKKYRSYIRNDLAGIGVLPLSAVSDVTVARWVQDMHDGGSSAKTIKNKHGFLSGAMKRAQATNRIQKNPCEHTRLYRSDTDEMVFLERIEFDLIHSQLTDRWKPFFLWLVSTGMRFSEATALTINDIDLAEGTVRINKAWKYSTTGRRLGLTKSKKGQRTINLAPQSLAVVDLDRDRTALLFPVVGGGPISSQLAWNKGWRPARDKAVREGLTKEPRIHDLRHTCASWMLNAGVPLLSVKEHLGHESIETTVNRYGHLDRAAGKVAADAISRALG